jgi:hypothetical protein
LGSSSTIDYSAQSGATVNAVAQNIATTSGFAGIIGTGANSPTYPGYNISYSSPSSGYGSDGHNGFYSTSVTSTDPKIVTTIFINNTTNLSKIYVNKELKTNVAGTSSTFPVFHTSGSKIFIGVSRSIGSTTTFIGNISEAIIFPSQLSDAVRNPLETNQSQTYLGPSVNITSSASGAVCAGTNITFTAVASNISTPTYQWYKNGAVISGETNTTYITSSLANADQIYVTATPGYTSGSISTSNLIANFDAANYNTSSTRWNDLSTSANHMDFYTSFNYTTLKTATYSSEGGGSLNVNNNNVYGRTINNTGITGNGAKTMSAWVKFDAADKDWTDIANFGSFAGWAQLFEMFGSRNGSGYQIFLIYSGSVVAGATTIPLNTWAYITISADGPSIKIYVNGILDGSANQALSTVNSPLYLGNSSSTSNYDNLRGKISTLSLWNSALSGQTILDNYNATKGRYTAVPGYTSNTLVSSINASPSAPTITVTGDGCSNKTILTRSTALGTYAWYKDNVAITGVTSNTYTPTAAGDYHVQVTSGSCSTNSTATTIFNCGNNAFGKMVALTNASSIISLEGGSNFGTGKDITGKIFNTTSFTTTSGTIGSTTAVLGGVISTTNAVTSSIGIMYSTDANFGTYSTTTIQSNVTAGTYTSTISGLSSSTNYHAKSFIVNKAGTSYGSVVSFSTSAPTLASTIVLDLDAGNSASYAGTGPTWTDLSGKGNHGTLVNSVTHNSAGYLVFSGNGPYVSLPKSTDFDFNTGDFTVENWIYMTSTNESSVYISLNVIGSSYAAFRMEHSNGKLYLSHSYDGTSYVNAGNFAFTRNAWQHIVVSRIAGSAVVYVNGVSKLAYSLPGSLIGQQNSQIGNLGRENSFYSFSGNIATTKIYKGKGLTSTEVLTQFDLTKSRFGL